jgi:phosphoglucosamine mutase
MVTASHNPHTDNGLKIFQHDGCKITAAQQQRVQQRFDDHQPIAADTQVGQCLKQESGEQSYVAALVALFAHLREFTGHIVVDCANGATSFIAPTVFDALGLHTTLINHQPDGVNINQACGSTDLKSLKETVRSLKADLGVAFDGDGDRLLMVDHNAQVIDGDDMLYALVRYHLSIGESVPGVVGTVMANEGLVHALSQHQVAFHRSAVGDRHVVSELLAREWRFGAEPSGHVIDMSAAKTGDGLMTFLHCLTCLSGLSWQAHQLQSAVIKFPQTLINVPVSAGFELSECVLIAQAEQAARAKMGATGRCLLRASGTEPVVRVMVECQNAALMRQVAEQLAQVVAQASAQALPV